MERNEKGEGGIDPKLKDAYLELSQAWRARYESPYYHAWNHTWVTMGTTQGTFVDVTPQPKIVLEV